MSISYLSLGSNLDDPIQQLKRAIKEIGNIPECIIIKKSSCYETKAIGFEQQNFYNMVLKIETKIDPHSLLKIFQSIENLHHRKRIIRWGPRTLDIDILLYDQIYINDEHLTIPHPRMHERGFVLVPLYEIEPELIMPNNIYIKDYLSSITHLDDITLCKDIFL